MKLSCAAVLLLLGSTGVTSLHIPQFGLIERDAVPSDPEFVDLEKRRGGGGGGRSGGFSGGGSGGRSSSSSRGGSSSSSSGRTSSSSNRGGSTSKGSGVSPSYGGGRYDQSSHSTHNTYNHYNSYGGSGSYGYLGINPFGGHHQGLSPYSLYWPWVVEEIQTSGASKTVKRPKASMIETKTHDRYYAGGARTPFAAGAKSPLGITPFLLPAAALAFFPGVWLYGAYAYPYTHPYYYMDEQHHKNESLPVVCLCQQYQECGCDDNNNRTYYESLFNGTVPTNTTNTRVVDVNGTEKIYINGTLANGTTSATSRAPASAVNLLHASGYWVTVAVVAAAVWSF